MRHRMVILTIVALASAACDGPARGPSTGASATKPAPKPSTSGSIVVDDFTDPSSGWAIPTIAEYRSGSLVVGHVEPGSTFIPAPIGFRGSRIVKATASIDGPGETAIGIFCQADLDIPFTGYLGSVDIAARTVKISRVELRSRTDSVLAEDPIDVSISLSEPLDPVLRCMQENEIARISFTVDDTTVVEVSDSSSLKAHSGGVFFYHAEPGTLGVFGDFEMVQLDAN
jgi:hypothetical protein